MQEEILKNEVAEKLILKISNFISEEWEKGKSFNKLNSLKSNYIKFLKRKI